MALSVGLIDSDSGASVFLHLLNNLATRADNGTDELLRNIECNDARYLWLHLGTWLREGLHHLSHDMLTPCLGLKECLLEDFERQSVAFNIHLCGRKTIHRTGSLEVHVAQVVLVAENITQDSVLVFTRILDKSHSYTGYRLLQRHAGVHQSERTCTYRGHRR